MGAAEKLWEDVYYQMKLSKFTEQDKYFLPNGLLEELIKEDAIRKALGFGSGKKDKRQAKPDVTFIYEKARKVFVTTLSVCNENELKLRTAMRYFKKIGFDDEHLPVTKQSRNDFKVVDKTSNIIDFQDSGLKMSTVDDFCAKQWQFLVPDIPNYLNSEQASSDMEQYDLSHNHVIPFVDRLVQGRGAGAFSEVSGYEIHPRHLRNTKDQAIVKYLAVKDLKHDPEVGKTWEDEVKALRRLGRRSHDHIVRFITAIRISDMSLPKHYLILEWADSGDLDTLLRGKPVILSPQLVKEACEQLLGLASALELAHYGLGERFSIRHGDLKPKNILRCSKPGTTIGTLKITDWGIAKEQTEVTVLRTSPTTNRYGTTRYQPPEVANLGNPSLLRAKVSSLTRLYDLWSMGCVSLELIIWLMYGPAQVNAFINELPKGCPLYDTVQGKFILHPVATRWIQHMSKDPACSKVLRSVLDIIENRLLVVELPLGKGDRRHISREKHISRNPLEIFKQLSPKLPQLRVSPPENQTATETPDHISGEPERPMRPIPPIVVPKIEISSNETEGSLQNPENLAPHVTTPRTGRLRDTAADFHSRMLEIVNNGRKDEQSYWITEINTTPPDSHPYTTPAEQNSGALHAPGIESMDYGQTRFDEHWKFLVNNEFATTVVSTLEDTNASFLKPTSRIPTRLCNKCRDTQESIWNTDFSVQYRTKYLRARIEADECDLCRLLWATFMRYGNLRDFRVRFDRRRSVLAMNGHAPVLSILRDLDFDVPTPGDIQIGLPELPEVGSEAHFDIIRSWINSCEKGSDHRDCRLSKIGIEDGETLERMPTRVIDVAKTDTQVFLHHPDPTERENWVALSHPWGDGEHYSLTRTEISKFTAGLELKDLPPTFRDAVIVTRALKQKYLWIDSLCIIQGPDGDFNEEAQRMEQVYSGAYCVISASCALGHYSGFLQPRAKRNFVTMKTASQASFYICEFIDDFQKHVLDGPLNKRAWVMQEHALARRTIFFTGSQTYWECGKGVRCETLVSMKHSLAASLGDPNFPKVLSDAARAERIFRYQQIYRDYSRLGLSIASDRPVAIDGLQSRLLRAMQAKGGYGIFDWGLTKGVLCRSLLWYRGLTKNSSDMPCYMSRINFPPDREINYVPSWSWMAYTGAIDYLPLEFGQFEWNRISPPWSREGTSSNYSSNDDKVALIAEAKQFTHLKSGNDQRRQHLIYDQSDQYEIEEPICVIVGFEKSFVRPAERRHYVLLIEPSDSRQNDGSIIYQRVGVGYLQGKYLVGEGFEVAIH